MGSCTVYDSKSRSVKRMMEMKSITFCRFCGRCLASINYYNCFSVGECSNAPNGLSPLRPARPTFASFFNAVTIHLANAMFSEAATKFHLTMCKQFEDNLLHSVKKWNGEGAALFATCSMWRTPGHAHLQTMFHCCRQMEW